MSETYGSTSTYGQDPRYGHVDVQEHSRSKPRPKVGFKQAIRNYFKYMFHFTGRASRSEFWWVQLLWLIIYVLVIAVGVTFIILSAQAMPPAGPGESPLELTATEAGFLTSFFGTYFGILILLLVQFITTLGLNWRRVQDTGMHGALSLINLVAPAMLVFGFIPSSTSGYQYDAPQDYDRP